jgi:hypothetical protein
MHWDLPAWLAGWLLIVPPIDLPWAAAPPPPPRAAARTRAGRHAHAPK